jgi:hypothetical protein
MKPTSILTITLLLAFAAPFAAAHVNVSSQAPTEPVPVGVPAIVNVTLSALCPVVVAEYSTKPELQLTLDNTTPEYLPFVGDTVPFTINQCSTSPSGGGYAYTTGKISITPTLMAPAFQLIRLKPGAEGETNQGGEFNLTVGYNGFINATLPSNVKVGDPFMLMLNVTANADTTLKIEVNPHQGMSNPGLPSEFFVDSPLLAGSPTRMVHVAVPGGWGARHGQHDGGNQSSPQANGTPTMVDHSAHGTASKLVFTITPVAIVNATAIGVPFEGAITFLAADQGGDDHHEEPKESKDTPVPSLAILLLALLAFATVTSTSADG